MSVEMKTLTIDGTTFEIVDEKSRNDVSDLKAELVTGKDSATENTRFAIGVAEQSLEVPSLDEFNQVKNDLDYLIKKDTINHIDKTNANYYGWDVLLPIYLEKDVRYIIGWAFTNDDNLTSPGVALKIVNNDTDRNVLQSIKTDYTQISSNGHPFTWTNDTGWYYLQISPTSQGTENTYKYVMCVEDAYIVENGLDWTTITYVNYQIIITSDCDESDHALLSDKIKSRWYGKVHLSYGDSITEQAVWQNLFKEYLGTSSEIVKGFSGQALWNHCKLDQLTGILGSETFDFATVMFGTNDWGQSRQIGVNTDFNDNGDYTGTYKGSLNTFCRNITTLFPSKRIIMVTPPNGFEDVDYNGEPFSDNGTKNLLGFTIKDYADAMKEICALWGIPCFDFNSVCGWNYINKATYLTDDGNNVFIHPNAVGGNEYAYKLAKFCEMN